MTIYLASTQLLPRSRQTTRIIVKRNAVSGANEEGSAVNGADQDNEDQASVNGANGERRVVNGEQTKVDVANQEQAEDNGRIEVCPVSFSM